MGNTTITGFGLLPCLHCGKAIKMDGEIHLCNAPNGEWLDNQEEAIIVLPNGDSFDLKKGAGNSENE